MLKRLSYNDAPAQLRKLIDELQKDGNYLVVQDEQHQPVACLAPLPNADKAYREEAARRLRELLDKVPPSPYSEEETYRLIDEAIAAVRRERKGQTVG